MSISIEKALTWRFCIYALIDPRDNNPFYVGMTSQLETRIKYHKYDGLQEIARRRRKPKINYPNPKAERMADLYLIGFEAQVMILESNVEYSQARKLEREWALTLKGLGYPIANKFSYRSK